MSPTRATVGVHETTAERQERLERLRIEFDEIDTNRDQTLSLKEIRSFLARKAGQDFDEVLCQELFASIDKDSDSLVTVEEFILSYVQAAELIQSRIDQLERQVSDNQQHLEEAERKLSEAGKNEKYSASGVMVGSVLTCHVREAKNLKATNMRGKSDPYAVLTCERQRIETKFVPSEINPVWDEVFTFQIEKREANLRVAVMDKATIGSDEFQGQVVIPLSTVEDQLKHDNYYELKGKDGSEGKYGKIRLGLQWIWSKVKYFETIVRQWQENLEMDRQELEQLRGQLMKLDKPFGFLLETKALKSISDVARPTQLLAFESNLSKKLDAVISPSLSIDWQWTRNISMCVFLAMSTLTMFARPCYSDVLLSSLFFYLQVSQSRSTRAYKALAYSFLLSFLVDCLYFLFGASAYEPEAEISIKRLSVFLSVLTFFLKFPISIIVWKVAMDSSRSETSH